MLTNNYNKWSKCSATVMQAHRSGTYREKQSNGG